MKVLIINDDGFNPAPFELYEALTKNGFEAKIVLPAGNFSCKSHATGTPCPSYTDLLDKMVSRQEKHWEKDIPYVVVEGTPVDCFRYALRLYKKIDFVIAGPNIGLNVGLETLSSSTVAIAREALSWGKRAIALSVESRAIVQDSKKFLV